MKIIKYIPYVSPRWYLEPSIPWWIFLMAPVNPPLPYPPLLFFPRLQKNLKTPSIFIGVNKLSLLLNRITFSILLLTLLFLIDSSLTRIVMLVVWIRRINLEKFKIKCFRPGFNQRCQSPFSSIKFGSYFHLQTKARAHNLCTGLRSVSLDIKTMRKFLTH